MRITLLTLLICLSCVSFFAQDKQESIEIKPAFDVDFDDGCGNPLVESQSYGYRRGEVIQISNSNELIVEVWNSINVWNEELEKESEDESKIKGSQIFKVTLVGIDKSRNKNAITAFLKENLLNKQITIIGNTKKKNSRKLQAQVQFIIDDELEEVSEYLLENGIAKFKQFQLTNLVPRRTACELERAETTAKNEKLGIWAN